jgi:AraC-like DNA-binding protein
MRKVVFSSSDLPAGLDERARFARWTEFYSDFRGACDQYRFDDVPFAAKFEHLSLGSVPILRFNGSVSRFARTERHVATDRRDHFGIAFNHIAGPGHFGDEECGRPGGVRFFTYGDPLDIRSKAGLSFTMLAMPRARLLELVANAEDLFHRELDPANPVMRYLGNYLQMLLNDHGFADDSELLRHIETTLVDVAALALGASRDAQEVARARGLRAARLTDVIAQIRSRFDDPSFSTDGAACAIGVSRRYVNDLLHETGDSFAERVLRLRLDKARVMLSDPRHDKLRINEIALACGFNEVSYFHRCFRRRFGASPAQFRGRA